MDEAMRPAAAELLEELLERVGDDDQDGLDPDVNRFEGALGALAEVGAADYDTWDARLRARLERPSAAEEEAKELEMNAGGTERDLVAVLPGPDEEVDGVRLLYALRFADGVSVVFRRAGAEDDDDFWESEIELRDDVGTHYFESGGSGGGDELRSTFNSAPPDGARWLELVGVASRPLRVRL